MLSCSNTGHTIYFYNRGTKCTGKVTIVESCPKSRHRAWILCNYYNHCTCVHVCRLGIKGNENDRLRSTSMYKKYHIVYNVHCRTH